MVNYPEDFWIQRDGVIGVEGPAEGDNTRQAPVYQKLAAIAKELGIKQIVDMGCNVGQLRLFLERAGWDGKYLGVDSNAKALDVARDNLKHLSDVELAEGNLRWLDIRGYSKESVFSKDLLEHLESFDLLRNMLEITRRYVVIASYIPWVDGPTRIVKTQEGYYMNDYNRDEIYALAADCNFIVHSEYQVQSLVGSEINQIVVFERVKKDDPRLERTTPAEPKPDYDDTPEDQVQSVVVRESKPAILEPEVTPEPVGDVPLAPEVDPTPTVEVQPVYDAPAATEEEVEEIVRYPDPGEYIGSDINSP